MNSRPPPDRQYIDDYIRLAAVIIVIVVGLALLAIIIGGPRPPVNGTVTPEPSATIVSPLPTMESPISPLPTPTLFPLP